MNKFFISLLSISVILLSSCSNGQTQSGKTTLSATDFSSKIKELSGASIIDVRSPEEYAGGHIPGAKNINWNGNDFINDISKLDKNKPVFIYCLSGGRSSSAASHMLADGFKEIYELQGGMMKWRSANLPETKDIFTTSSGMSKEQYEALKKTDKVLLIDFYADWCAPCKKMKPYLDEIESTMKDKVTVVRINADDNQNLTLQLGIEALPTLQIFKNSKMIWSNVGYVTKEELLKQVQQ